MTRKYPVIAKAQRIGSGATTASGRIVYCRRRHRVYRLAEDPGKARSAIRGYGIELVERSIRPPANFLCRTVPALG